MAELPRHSVSVAAAIVRDDGRILAIRRRDNGHWEPPGGILELAERIEDGVIREVHEETGLTVAVERLTGIYKNMNRDIIALVFRCHVTNGTPRPTDEVTNTAWLAPDELRDHMNEAYAVRLTDALTTANVPIIRHHDGTNLIAT